MIDHEALKFQELLKKRLYYINRRCNDPKLPAYVRYGGRGIRNELTIDNLARLWIRDNAGAMVKPSIHRLDNDGHYSFDNCCFLEWEEHKKITQDKTRGGHGGYRRGAGRPSVLGEVKRCNLFLSQAHIDKALTLDTTLSGGIRKALDKA